MKNWILVILVSVLSILKIYSQNITFKDPNFKYALVNLNVVDTNLDGIYDGDVDTNNDKEISISEAEAVVSLSLNYFSTKEIPEIYFFKNLKYFYSLTGQIAQFPDINRLPLIENLSFALLKDTIVEIIAHPNIKRCTLSVREPLKKLSINQNAKLNYLNIYTYVGSPMPAIDTLDVSNNVLDTFICKAIKPRILESYFSCSNNKLTSVVNLPINSFYTSNLSNNNLNAQLIGFEGKNLDLSANRFSSLTIKMYNGICNLNLLDNPFTHLTFDAVFANVPQIYTDEFPDLSSFTNLELVKISIRSEYSFKEINIKNLPNLKSLEINGNCDTSIFLNNLPVLEKLKLYTNSPIVIQNVNPAAFNKIGPEREITVNNKLTLDNCLAGSINLKYIGADHLELINNPLLLRLKFDEVGFYKARLTIENNTNLVSINNKNSGSDVLTHVILKNLPSLDSVDLVSTAIVSFDYENIPNISYFKLIGRHPLFVFDGYQKLRDIHVHPNGVHLFNLPYLKTITFQESTITSFKLENLPALEGFNYLGNYHSTTTINSHSDFVFRDFPKLKSILIGTTSFSSSFFTHSLILENLPELDTFYATDASYAQFKNVYFNNLPKLKNFKLNAKIRNAQISNCNQLKNMFISAFGSDTIYESIRIHDNAQLEGLIINTIRYEEAIISNNPKLKTIKFLNYSCRNLKLNNLPALERIVEDNDVISTVPTKITFSKLPVLRYFQTKVRYFDTLDFSECPVIDSIYFHRWPNNYSISYLNLKNGNPKFSYLDWPTNNSGTNNNIKNICSDSPEEEANLKKYIRNSAKSTFTQDCEFNYTLAYYDGRVTSQYSNSNHVISNTTYFPINIYDDQNLTRVFTDGGGIYRYRTESKDKLISIEPAIFNPNYEYNGQAIIFDPNQYGVFVNQDFALSIKNPIADIEAFIHSQQAAVPGTEYKIKLEIKNTTPFDAACSFQLSYDHEYMKIKNSGGLQNNVAGIISGESGNISPYSSVIIPISFILNKPTDTPPLNLNDQLTFHLVTFPLQADLTEENNSFSKKLRVVNSFDPNNIICAQGDEVTSNEEINKIFYTINFENLGNAAAKNIRIENPIDTNWLDVNSFEVVNYSHPALVSITGDLATYHFENIELPATGANKGYITYAIRPKKELVKGDTIPNKADIYFDFNFPIATNRHTLTLVVPNGSNEIIEEPVNLYPNPASTGFYISAAKISSITICDLIGNEVYKNHNPDSFVSFDLPNGGYLVNITLSNGLMVKRKLVVVR